MKKTLLFLTALFGCFAFANAQFSIQNVVIEEYTGAWCPYCADGVAIMEGITANYEKAIPVAIHQGDAMETPLTSTLAGFYGPNYPTATINREGAPIGRNLWSSAVSNASQGASTASVSINNVTYDPQTREVELDVDVQFTGPENDELRFNLFIVQDEMTGSGSGWDQANADNNTVGHMFYQAGNPIPNFVHKHVLREMLDGAWGASGSITTPVNFGSTASRHYSFTLNQNYDENGISFVGVVQKYAGNGQSDREILNAEEFHLSSLTVGAEELNAASNHIEVFPNPMSDLSKIQFSLAESGNIRMEVLNVAGQHVATLGEGHMNAGLHTMHWDATNDAQQAVESGIYLVRLVTEHGQSLTKKVMVTR